jgi:hypothetical protein
MNTYKYTMQLSPVMESKLLSSIENTNAKLVFKVIVEVSTDLNEEQKKKDLDDKIGTKTPDGMYEFIGYEELVKIIK